MTKACTLIQEVAISLSWEVNLSSYPCRTWHQRKNTEPFQMLFSKCYFQLDIWIFFSCKKRNNLTFPNKKWRRVSPPLSPHNTTGGHSNLWRSNVEPKWHLSWGALTLNLLTQSVGHTCQTASCNWTFSTWGWADSFRKANSQWESNL